MQQNKLTLILGAILLVAVQETPASDCWDCTFQYVGDSSNIKDEVLVKQIPLTKFQLANIVALTVAYEKSEADETLADMMFGDLPQDFAIAAPWNPLLH